MRSSVLQPWFTCGTLVSLQSRSLIVSQPPRKPGSAQFIPVLSNALSSVWRETLRGGERREGKESVHSAGVGVLSI